jgi:hypothetical protein
LTRWRRLRAWLADDGWYLVGIVVVIAIAAVEAWLGPINLGCSIESHVTVTTVGGR